MRVVKTQAIKTHALKMRPDGMKRTLRGGCSDAMRDVHRGRRYLLGFSGKVGWGLGAGLGGAETVAGAVGAAGPMGGFGSAETAAMIFSVAALLTAQAKSQMRHCARVNLQPHVQLSALKRWRTIFFCSSVSFERSTPGSTVARSACARKTSPLSSKVSTLAMMGIPSNARISVS